MEEVRRHLAHYIVARLVRLNLIQPAQLEVALSPSDQEKAARFRFPDDRTRFLAGRALLAKMLDHFVDPQADLTQLTVTEAGRPILPTPAGVEFSISHAGELVMVALATGTRVGVDVERTERPLDFEGLARRIFNDRDLHAFLELPPDERVNAFFRAWTGKEAILKARGVGLFGGLQEVSVPWNDSATEGLDVAGGEDWRLRRLPVPDDYAAHVAWEGANRKIDFSEVTLDGPMASRVRQFASERPPPLNVASSSEEAIGRELSNFAKRRFVFHRKNYHSVEGWYQGLKWPDEKKRRELAKLSGPEAKRAAKGAPVSDHFIFAGRTYLFGSPEHHSLVKDAIRESLRQNPALAEAFRQTHPRPIVHDTGRPDHFGSALPAEKFAQILAELRQELVRESELR
jgi:4'-phosphopantetheinyl transferase